MTGYQGPADEGIGPHLERALRQHLWGILHAHEGRYEEAGEAFLRAVEIEPGMVGSYVELGLVYACRKEYAGMVEALRRAVVTGAGGVRSYLGERPLGDIPTEPSPGLHRSAEAGAENERESVLPLLASAMSLLAAGRYEMAEREMEQAGAQKLGSPPVAVALLTLSYLLRGERVEADDSGIRRVPPPAMGE
jgi:tetratricopeptide (TPR) repeat protein